MKQSPLCFAAGVVAAFLVVFSADLAAREAFYKIHERSESHVQQDAREDEPSALFGYSSSKYDLCVRSCKSETTKLQAQVTKLENELNDLRIPAVSVLLKLRANSEKLQGEWQKLNVDTKDTDLAAMDLPGVTMNGCGKLTALNLPSKKISGPVPSFEKNVALEAIDLSNNQLSGEVPSFEKNTALETLRLNDNQLIGPVPDFSRNVLLERLRLQNNNLEGSIPSFENSAALKSLNLRNNNLSGAVEWKANKSNYPAGIYDVKV